MVNGGHGIKNPLFDCATEALQIKYGNYNKIIPRKNNLSHFSLRHYFLRIELQ